MKPRSGIATARISLAWVLVAIVLVAPRPAAAERAVVDWSRARGDSVELAGHLDVAAPRAIVWEVLTDYDRMSRFLPGLQRSHRIATTPEGPLVEQVGDARVLFIGRRFSALFQMREQPQTRVGFRAVSGDLRDLTGSWSLDPLPGDGTRVTYRSHIVRGSNVPAMLRAWIIRQEWLARARALGREAERRARLTRHGPA